MERTTLKDTIDHLPGGLLITDRESRVLYASGALEQRTGFSVAEIVGKKPGELWGGKMKKEFYRSLWHTIGTEGKAFVGQVHNARKNGARHDEHMFVVPIRDHAGQTAYFAEIHPELSGREAEEVFGREFISRTKSMIQDGDFFSWVFQSLRKKKDGTLVGPDQPLWYDGFQDAAQFFREAFVTPMEKVFAHRKADALLVAHAQENPEKFSQLYEKYASSVREYFLRRLGGDMPLAEDLTQEVFVRSFRYLPGFRMANASYYTYLLHVAHSVLVNHYRKQKYDTVSYQNSEAMADTAVTGAYCGEEGIDTLLQTLSLGERTVMLLKYRDGLKAKEIAQRIGKTENAVKLIWSRSRKKLKKELG